MPKAHRKQASTPRRGRPPRIEGDLVRNWPRLTVRVSSETRRLVNLTHRALGKPLTAIVSEALVAYVKQLPASDRAKIEALRR